MINGDLHQSILAILQADKATWLRQLCEALGIKRQRQGYSRASYRRRGEVEESLQELVKRGLVIGGRRSGWRLAAPNPKDP